MKQKVSDIIYKRACTLKDFYDGRLLFQEYADSIGIDLSFQDFDRELEIIDLQYNKPDGVLIIAYSSEKAAGCAGIRKLNSDTAELKRMFVRPEFRGKMIGRSLLELCIKISEEFSYKKIRLDTLPGMMHAQKLYYTYGFYEIPPYRFNPVEVSVFLEKVL